MNNEFEYKLRQNIEIVNAVLEKYLNICDKDYNILFDAMRYSSLAGGKRIRAFLCLEFFSVFYKLNQKNNKENKNNLEIIMPVACAIEMIHTYSLIHDDLPCMDDDDLRRGIPTNHVKFGEATAVLSGDALLTFAFNIISNAVFLQDYEKIRIIAEISKAAGHFGMIGGQMMDMLYEDKNIDMAALVKTHILKTGNMIIVSAVTGCIAGGACEAEINLAADYAKNIGLAFQVVDDILDKTGDAKILGKNTRSDEKNGKNTFLNVFDGQEKKAWEYAKELTDKAVLKLEELKKINKNADTKNLEVFAEYLLKRIN